METLNWSLKEIVEHARIYSPFYRELYKDIQFSKLSDLPITDQSVFWKSKVVTSDTPDGIVFKSGGSTGAPKFSYFTSLEWQSFTRHFGNGIAQGILDDGDRVANLFYVGDLYSSFIFIKDSLQWIPADKKKITQFPIAGATEPKQILKTMEEFNINMMIGVPSAILTLLDFYEKHKTEFPKIKVEKVLFGGESLYPDQYKAYLDIFPKLKISSVGYASVDAGLLGYADCSCGDGEHRVFDGANIIEIIDPETNEVITELNRVGKVLVTNLTRKLMPIIRYPAGDLAMWVETPETPCRKFKLQGRSDEAARLGTLSVYFEDTRLMAMTALKEVSGLQFQMVLNHYDHKDELTLRLAGHSLRPGADLSERILIAFKKEKIVYEDLLKKNLIHPLKIEIIDLDQMEGNTRTGKLKRVIDKRKE